MEKRKISILGSTGSIGTTALKLASRFPDRFEIIGLAAGDNVELFADQVKKFHPLLACTKTEEGMKKLKTLTSSVRGLEYDYGILGAKRVACLQEAHTVLSAIVGAAGLKPTLAAAQKGKRIALANKESMVVAGALVSQTAKESGAQIFPVDSEHSAIFQALAGSNGKDVRQLILTASGGPFFLQKEKDLSKVTRQEALNHPNWSMGEKITIDSATLMNKGLEIVEARWLFDFPISKIGVVIHPQSVIHSMVEYVDGSILAQLGVPDMAGPISYALAYPSRVENVMQSIDFSKLRELNFFEPDHERFPSIQIARQAVEMGETFPAVLNGANEVTVQAFLDEKIAFPAIFQINRQVLEYHRQTACGDLEDYLAADQWARLEAKKRIDS